MDYILTGGHDAECTRVHGISIHNRDTLGADWIAGLPLDEQALEMAKEIAMINLSWPALRIYQHVKNVLLPGVLQRQGSLPVKWYVFSIIEFLGIL